MLRTPAASRLTALALVALATTATAEPIRLAGYEFDPLVETPSLPAALSAPVTSPDESSVFLVQLRGPVTEGNRLEVEAHVRILGYLPDHAFLVEATSTSLADLAARASVRWTGAWHPAYKLSPEIGTHEFASPSRAEDPVRTLRVWAIGDEIETRRRIEAAGARVEQSFARRMGHRFVVRAGDERLEELARIPSVLWMEEIPEFRVLNDRTTWVAQSNQTNQHSIWDEGLHGENQIAVVMDSGLDYNSCWFRDPGETPGPTHRKVIDYDTFGGSAYDGCDFGHGTHVCGTLAGNQNPVTGSSAANGVAYEAQLILQDIGADDFLSCLFGFVNVPGDLTNAFQTGYNGGGRVHSNSWGSTSNSYDGFAVDVDEFMWSHPDFLILFAAGNGGPGSSTVGTPGTAKSCVTVGATQQSPNQGSMASYSSRGPAHDSRRKPTVVLPGGDSGLAITSADNNTGNPPSNTCNTIGSPFFGTSMATPATSGSALLVRQYFTEGWYPSGSQNAPDAFSPSGALLKAALVNGAADIGSANIPNHDEGWGRVLLDDALFFDGDARELRVEEDAGISTGQTDSYVYEVETGESLEITLVWSDFPATSGASVALVNDLDLEVVGPGGTYRGNVFSGGQSTTGGSFDNRNVEECVRLASPAAGSYTVRVLGNNVPQGPQPYAIVSTGAFASWPPIGTAAGEGIAVGAVRLDLALSPNPSSGAVDIRLSTTADVAPREAVVEVYDLRGVRVATPWTGSLAPGQAVLRWDGRDARGRTVPAGIYFVRAVRGSEAVSKKLVLVR